MQIVALTAVNLKPKYLSCVPAFIDFWLSLKSSKQGITYKPKVIVIAETLPEELEKYQEWCEVFDVGSKIPSSFASQAIRVFYPSLEEADYVVTTDVDMLPMTDRLFQVALSEISAGSEFVIGRDVLPKGQFPICYNLATPAIWGSINSIRSNGDVLDSLAKLFEKVNFNGEFNSKHGGTGWFADQEELYRMVTEFELMGGKVERLNDSSTGHLRLDRLFTPFPLNWLTLAGVALGLFTDYHVHHPISNFSKFLRSVAWLRNRRVGSNRR